MASGGAQTELEEMGAARVLRSSGSSRGVRAGSVEVQRGSGRTAVHRRLEITADAELTGGGSWVKFPRVQASYRGKQARGLSWARGGAATRLWWALGAAERWNHGGAVVLVWRRGCGRGAGVQRWRRCGEGRAQGRSRCAKIKEGRGFWVCVPGVDAAVVTAEDHVQAGVVRGNRISA